MSLEAEAQRTFWRSTVLPLVERVAAEFSHWLGSSSVSGFSLTPSSGPLRLVPDIDTLPALASEREALWTSLEKTSFLTDAEKRTLAGFSPEPAPDAKRFNPNQPRISSGQPGAGQWTDGEGGGGDGAFGRTPDGTPADPAARRPRGGDKRPDPSKPGSDTSKQPEYKKPKSGQSGKESASDVPSWVRESGDRPLIGEDGKTFAKRVLDKKYPDLKGQHDTGPTSDFSRIKKWADRHFE